MGTNPPITNLNATVDTNVGQRVLIKSVNPANQPCQYAGAIGVIESERIIGGLTFYVVDFDNPVDGVNSAAYSESGGCVLFL